MAADGPTVRPELQPIQTFLEGETLSHFISEHHQPLGVLRKGTDTISDAMKVRARQGRVAVGSGDRALLSSARHAQARTELGTAVRPCSACRDHPLADADCAAGEPCERGGLALHLQRRDEAQRVSQRRLAPAFARHRTQAQHSPRAIVRADARLGPERAIARAAHVPFC